MSIKDSTQYGLVMRFDVVVDGIDLGAWSSCDGLKVDFGLKEIKVGGTNDYKVYLPDRVNYPRLVLKRAMNASDSGKVMTWLRSMAAAEVYDCLRDDLAQAVGKSVVNFLAAPRAA